MTSYKRGGQNLFADHWGMTTQGAPAGPPTFATFLGPLSRDQYLCTTSDYCDGTGTCRKAYTSNGDVGRIAPAAAGFNTKVCTMGLSEIPENPNAILQSSEPLLVRSDCGALRRARPGCLG